MIVFSIFHILSHLSLFTTTTPTITPGLGYSTFSLQYSMTPTWILVLDPHCTIVLIRFSFYLSLFLSSTVCLNAKT